MNIDNNGIDSNDNSSSNNTTANQTNDANNGQAEAWFEQLVQRGLAPDRFSYGANNDNAY